MIIIIIIIAIKKRARRGGGSADINLLCTVYIEVKRERPRRQRIRPKETKMWKVNGPSTEP